MTDIFKLSGQKLKELRDKIRKGDFSGLLGFTKEKPTVHAAEVSALLEDLPVENVLAAFNSFPLSKQIQVFPYLELPVQEDIFQDLPNERAAALLNALSSDDRLTFLSSLKGIDRSAALDLLSNDNKKTTHDLLGYPENSVARILNTDFATVSKDMTIAEANEHLRKYHKDSEAANVIYIVDKNGKLIDDIPVRRFVLNDPFKRVEDILDGFCTRLHITDSKKQAVTMFKEFDRVALP
ncbi:MAG: magnesium transporter, partial [Bacteroidota bacterium]|nr:magnesium transporter [Bacteroidota bacterium]